MHKQDMYRCSEDSGLERPISTLSTRLYKGALRVVGLCRFMAQGQNPRKQGFGMVFGHAVEGNADFFLQNNLDDMPRITEILKTPLWSYGCGLNACFLVKRLKSFRFRA